MALDAEILEDLEGRAGHLAEFGIPATVQQQRGQLQADNCRVVLKAAKSGSIAK